MLNGEKHLFALNLRAEYPLGKLFNIDLLALSNAIRQEEEVMNFSHPR
jgi:phosphoribosyl-dephospho-CoA transferase